MRKTTSVTRSAAGLLGALLVVIGSAVPVFGGNDTVSLTRALRPSSSQITDCRKDGLLFSQSLSMGCGIHIQQHSRQLSPEVIKQLFSRLDAFDWEVADAWNAKLPKSKKVYHSMSSGWKISYRGKTRAFVPVLKDGLEVPIKDKRWQELQGIVDLLTESEVSDRSVIPDW